MRVWLVGCVGLSLFVVLCFFQADKRNCRSLCVLSHLLVCRNKRFNLVKPAQKERKEQQLPSLQLRKVPMDSRHHFPPKSPTGGLEFSTLDALKELFISLFILFYFSKHGI